MAKTRYNLPDMMRLSQYWMQGLLRCQRGAMAVEFAIVGALLLLVVMMAIEFGLILFVQSTVERGTIVGSRVQAAAGASRAEFIRREIAQQSGNFIKLDALQVSTQPYNTTSNNGAEPCLGVQNGATCSGNFIDINGNGRWDAAGSGQGNLLIYTVTYPWQVFTPLLWPFLGDGQGNYTIEANVIVRNEVL